VSRSKSNRSLPWLALLPLALAAAGAGTLQAADPASPLRVESSVSTVEWKVRQNDRTLFSYAFVPGTFKPYVKTLATVDGDNLLRDAPHDHLHHHALMFAIRVNGINFWEETTGCGVQRPVQTAEPTTRLSPAGLPQATLTQRLHWLAPENAFLHDTTPKALLLEQRTLTLTVDAPRREVALLWRSEFEVGPATNAVTLGGANYYGLGVRFLQELDPLADHFTATGRLDLADNRQDVSRHPWAAVAFNRPARPATFALFGHPQNPGGPPWFFSMRTPFAYLSATQQLDQQPRQYTRGERFALEYLVVVQSGSPAAAALEARRERWLNQTP
jgi:hypothetical protein